jgi:hypothetical protein
LLWEQEFVGSNPTALTNFNQTPREAHPPITEGGFMYTLAATILSLLVTALIFCCFLLYRNNQVCNYRLRLIDEASRKARQAIAAGDPNWRKCYDNYEKVSYDQMFWQWWKPLDSFYNDMAGKK